MKKISQKSLDALNAQEAEIFNAALIIPYERVVRINYKEVIK